MINWLKRWLCYLVRGHVWRDEKEFVSCERCHLVLSKRELTARRK